MSRAKPVDGFEEWIGQFEGDYESLSEDEKLEFVSRLLVKCGPREKWQLQAALPSLLFGDFVTDLPTEILEKVLTYLTCSDLLNACLVSTKWYHLLSGLSAVWKVQARRLGHAGSLEDKNGSWKVAAIFSRDLRRQIKLGKCFLHQSEEKLIKSGTYFAALSHDKGFLAFATCDYGDGADNGYERTIIYSLSQMKRFHTFNVPPHVSVVKLVYPEVVVCGHVDGNLTTWDLRASVGSALRHYKGHTAAILAIDVNQSLDLLISGSADFSTKVWNLTTGALVKSLSGFSHWVVHLVMKEASEHELVRFKGRNIILAMTRDNMSMYTWETADKEDIHKNLVAVTTPDYQVPLRPSDGLTWREFFFTPGMQLFGQKIAFVRQAPMFDTHTVGDADIVIANANTGQVMKTVHINQKIRKLLAVGNRFALILLPFLDSRYKNLAIVDLEERKIIGGCTVPHSRANNPDFTQVTTGDLKWLDGFSRETCADLLVGLSTSENFLYLVKWNLNKKA